MPTKTAILKATASLQVKAESYWVDYCEIFPKLVKFDCPRIILNGRLTKTAGRNHSEDNLIHLGTQFFAKHSVNMIDVILPHELAHQIDFNLFGWHDGKKHHGKDWITVMVKTGQNPNPYHSMEI